MLELEQCDFYEEAYQQGYEMGVSEVQISSIVKVIEDIRISLSDEKWIQYKTAREEKHRKYVALYPEQKNSEQSIFDENGDMIREKWMEMCLFFAETCFRDLECWNDIAAFNKKYPNLSAVELAKRIVRESEYKYV